MKLLVFTPLLVLFQFIFSVTLTHLGRTFGEVGRQSYGTVPAGRFKEIDLLGDRDRAAFP